jgi:hypothetical protein
LADLVPGSLSVATMQLLGAHGVGAIGDLAGGDVGVGGAEVSGGVLGRSVGERDDEPAVVDVAKHAIGVLRRARRIAVAPKWIPVAPLPWLAR